MSPAPFAPPRDGLLHLFGLQLAAAPLSALLAGDCSRLRYQHTLAECDVEPSRSAPQLRVLLAVEVQRQQGAGAGVAVALGKRRDGLPEIVLKIHSHIQNLFQVVPEAPQSLRDSMSLRF